MRSSVAGQSPSEILARLRDPDDEVFTLGWMEIGTIEDMYYSGAYPEYIMNEIVEMMLIRLRKETPCIYAITVGRFPYFDQIEEYWHTEGYKDPQGFTWLVKAV